MLAASSTSTGNAGKSDNNMADTEQSAIKIKPLLAHTNGSGHESTGGPVLAHHSAPPTAVPVSPSTMTDLFAMLSTSQSDRMESQRSSVVPMDMPMLFGTTNTPQRSRFVSKLIRKPTKGSGSDVMARAKPLQAVASYYSHFPGDMEKILAQSASGRVASPKSPSTPRQSDTSKMIMQSDGWWIEVGATEDDPLLELGAAAVISRVDHGIQFYRKNFFGHDHANFVGVSETVGSIAVSLRRCDSDASQSYMAVIRSEHDGVTRVEISESDIPYSGEIIGWQDVLDRVLPESISRKCIRQAKVESKLPQALVMIDECMTGCISRSGIENYKFGVLHCLPGQACEEEFYGNKEPTPALLAFLDTIATKVKLKGHKGFRAGLNVDADTTGTHSYYTKFNDAEVMFHVAPLIPYKEGDKQQVDRKRHVGNDCVTILFMEEGAGPVSPGWFKSDFQKIVLFVQPFTVNGQTKYRMGVAGQAGHSNPFLPALGDGEIDASEYEAVRRFILSKAINAEHSWYVSRPWLKRCLTVRKRLLKDAVNSYITDIPADGNKPMLSFLPSSLSHKLQIWSAKKKLNTGDCVYGKDASRWLVKMIRDDESGKDVELVISSQIVVVIDAVTSSTIHHLPTTAVVGWIERSTERLDIVLDHSCGEISISTKFYPAVIRSLTMHTDGAALSDVSIRRDSRFESWGFELDGNTAVVNNNGPASQCGIKTGDSVRTLNGVGIASLLMDEIKELMNKEGNRLRAQFIPGHDTDKLVPTRLTFDENAVSSKESQVPPKPAPRQVPPRAVARPVSTERNPKAPEPVPRKRRPVSKHGDARSQRSSIMLVSDVDPVEGVSTEA